MEPLLIITGPTAVGKTALSIEVAKRLNGEIISADSMQVYKKMNIGTAKVTKEEMQGIRHFMIDELMPDEEFNVIEFKSKAKEYIRDIRLRGKLPIIAGGTGFYIQSVLYDVEFSDYSTDEQERIHSELEKELEEKGIDFMFEKLRQIDPEYCMVIHKNNIRRVLHGIEFYEINKYPISRHNLEQRERTSPYNFKYIVLNDEREAVYDRINRRVDKMIEDGLVEEVRGLLEEGYSRSLPSMLGLGYKETADYLSGECSLETAVELIKRDTRHFAKKQLTWFKRERDVIEINRKDFDSENQLLEHILKISNEIFL